MVVACWIGCGEAPPETAFEGRATIRDSAGITVIENHEPVCSGNEWRIEPEPAIQIGAVEGDTPYIFSNVARALHLPDGRTVLVESSTREIRVFDAAGRHLTSFGGEGSGPAEFQAMPLIAFDPPSSILAFDVRARRITRFDLNGSLRNERSLVAAMAGLPATNIAGASTLLGDGTLVLAARRVLDGRPTEPGATVKQWKQVLVLRAGRDPVEIAFFPDPVIVFYGDAMVDDDPFGVASVLAASDEPRAVLVASLSQWQVDVHDEDGRVARIIRAPIPRQPTDAALDAYRARLREMAVRRGRAPETYVSVFDAREVADSLQAIESLHWDRSGYLWVGRLTEWDQESPTVYDVFDQQGQWLSTVRFPDGIASVFDISDGRVATRWRDEFDVQYVRVYRIISGCG
jgi:hypothetical protein